MRKAINATLGVTAMVSFALGAGLVMRARTKPTVARTTLRDGRGEQADVATLRGEIAQLHNQLAEARGDTRRARVEVAELAKLPALRARYLDNTKITLPAAAVMTGAWRFFSASALSGRSGEKCHAEP